MSYLDDLPSVIGYNVLLQVEIEKRKRRGKCNSSKLVLEPVGTKGTVRKIGTTKCDNLGSLKLTICNNGIRHSPLYYCDMCTPDVSGKSGKAYYYKWNHKRCNYDQEAYKVEEINESQTPRKLRIVI